MSITTTQTLLNNNKEFIVHNKKALAKILAFVEVREGSQILTSGSSTIQVIQSLMLNYMTATQVMLKFAQLRAGNTFTFKCKDKSLTVKPLHGHIDNY